MNKKVNKENKYKQQFTLFHWLLTLVLGPFLYQIFTYMWGKNQIQMFDFLELYPLLLVFSIVFSIPTLIIYLLANFYLTRIGMEWKLVKVLLVAISITGVVVTIIILAEGSMMTEIPYAYSAAAFFSGFILSFIFDSKLVNDKSPE